MPNSEQILKQADPIRRPSVATAYREILDLIYREALTTGDHIPPQSTLRTQFRLGNDSISEAMRWLIADGVLSRSRQYGTRVMEPQKACSGFSVGLIIPGVEPAAPGPFVCSSLHFLQHYMRRTGCWFDWLGPLQDNDMRRVMNGELPLTDVLPVSSWDAVVTTAGFAATSCQEWMNAGLLTCHVGSDENTLCGVVIDHGAFVRDAMRDLVKAGCRTPALLLPGRGRYSRATTSLEHCAAEHKITSEVVRPEPDECVADAFNVESDMRTGRHLAQQLLSRWADRRPDALIVVGDYVGLSLSMVLADSDYRPLLLVQTNAQVPLGFSPGVLRYAVDLADMASRAALLPLRVLRRQLTLPFIDWVVPRRCE